MNSNIRPKSLKTIADRCGVSVMTVSRALRGSDQVKPETREKVLREAGDLDYRHAPSGRPRAVSTAIRPTVDVVIGNAGKPQTQYYANMLMSIESELSSRGYDCVVRAAEPVYEQFLTLTEALRTTRAEGVFITGYFSMDRLKTLLDIAPRAILVDDPGDPRMEKSYDSVGFDNGEAAYMAIRHLKSKGRRRIALLNGFPEHYFSREIRQGYLSAMAIDGAAPDPELLWEGDFTAESAWRKTVEAMDRGVAFDAIFTTDEMASGVYRALWERGKQIPRDVAVCGCDGLPIGEQACPRLTTIELDYRKLGRLAVERLVGRDKILTSVCAIKLPPRLIVRESA